MSKHEADPSFRTIVVNAKYAAQYGPNTPDRNGKHRKWNAVKVRIVNGPTGCAPCERIRIARMDGS